MKNLSLLVLLFSTLSFNNVSAFKDAAKVDPHVATCTGSRSCYACSSCRYCKHCNAGGTCGVCTSGTSTARKNVPASGPTVKSSNSSSSQCQGTTKKGARCKRIVRGGGYCWQHK
ncbi:DUF5763 domain-containing protein [Pedobacter steynii]